MKQYRLLNKGEEIRATDEYYQPDIVQRWMLADSWMVGSKVSHILVPIRREIILGEPIEDNDVCAYCKKTDCKDIAGVDCFRGDLFTGKKLFTMVDA